MMTFRNQASVSAFGKAINLQSFNFSKVSVDDVLKEINKFGLYDSCDTIEEVILS